jgi:4,5-dihydroxyphthalate decarboxylase
MAPLTRLRAALGDYPHTLPLKQHQIASDQVAFDFVEIKPVYKAFACMVREQAFDVSEMAIVTCLQAVAYGRPLVLLPATMMGRFQHHCMLHNAERGRLVPADLPGRRVGVRSFAQTTGAWLRGILANDYGVDLGRVHWVTFEDAHVPEFRDPPGVERVGGDKNMTKMLLAGELDAAIFGAELPEDPRLRSVIPDPHAAARAWHARHGVVPINHMVVVSKALAQDRADLVREVYRLLLAGKAAAAAPPAGAIDLQPFGFSACRAAVQMMADYALQLKLVPRRLDLDELFDITTRALSD